MSSPSLRPLIDTCQKCSTSPANHEPRSPANGSFQNPGVCPQAVSSFPSPTPTVLFFGSRPIFRAGKIPKTPFSWKYLCSQTLRKRLLRRLASAMLNSISRLGETRPEQEWSNGTEFSGYSDFPERRVHSKRIPKFSKTFPGIFTVPFSFGPEISVFLVEWKAPKDSFYYLAIKNNKIRPKADKKAYI